MLQSNYSQLITTGSNIGGQSTVSNKFFIKENEWFGVTMINETAGYPEGYGNKSFAMPLKSGSISTLADVDLTASGSGAMGINIEATSDLSLFFGDAYGDLIVSGQGSASFDIQSSGNVIAGLYGIGSASYSVTASNNSVFADGYASAQLDIVTSGQGQLTAIAICSGNSVDTSVLTPASIWSYGDRTLTSIDIEVSGLTVEEHNKLMSTSTKADVYNASMI